MASPNDRDALVECMARAMWEQGDPILPQPPKWGELSRSTKDATRERATAALTALEAAGLAVVPVEAMEEAEIMSHDAGSEGRKWRQKYAVSPYTQAKPACSKCGAQGASPVTGMCWSCDTTAL